jgi:KDO2-lipid IV(A) lauroyltransferase
MGAWFINGVMGLFSLITPRASRFLAPPLAWVFWYLNSRRRHITRRNIELCYPGLDSKAQKKLARDSLVHYVRNIFEAGILWFWKEQRFLKLFDEPVGQETLDVARQAGNGVIIAAPHFGSWELCSLYLRNEFDGAVLYKPGRSAAFNNLLHEKRTRTGIEMVPANQGGLKAIFRHLKNGRAVGILPDQEPSFGDGEFAPMMGINTLTGVLIPRLVQKTGAKVVFVACERMQSGRFRVHFMAAGDDIGSPDIHTSLAALNRGVEDCIAISPAQYLWCYKRFRNRPQGEPPIY